VAPALARAIRSTLRTGVWPPPQASQPERPWPPGGARASGPPGAHPRGARHRESQGNRRLGARARRMDAGGRRALPRCRTRCRGHRDARRRHRLAARRDRLVGGVKGGP